MIRCSLNCLKYYMSLEIIISYLSIKIFSLQKVGFIKVLAMSIPYCIRAFLHEDMNLFVHTVMVHFKIYLFISFVGLPSSKQVTLGSLPKQAKQSSPFPVSIIITTTTNTSFGSCSCPILMGIYSKHSQHFWGNSHVFKSSSKNHQGWGQPDLVEQKLFQFKLFLLDLFIYLKWVFHNAGASEHFLLLVSRKRFLFK